MLLLILSAGIFGFFIGSFLNVVVWRVPRGASVVAPRSSCTTCGTTIRPIHNIPVLSWLLLHGKCAYCRARFSWRYPAVEALTGAVFSAIAFWVGLSWLLAAFLYFAALSIVLALIDWDTQTLPDSLVLPAYPVALGLLALAAWNPGGDPAWTSLRNALISGAAVFLLYFLIWWFFPRGMGFGDVKLAGLVGLHLGFFGFGVAVVGTFAAFLFGGVFALILAGLHRVGRKSKLPFGPWMLFGAWFGFIAGSATWNWYLSIAL